MNAMKIPVIVFLIWAKQHSHLILLISKVVLSIGILWNLFLEVSLHQTMPQINLGLIRQEDMVIISPLSPPQLPS
jgi:hypothetical protein